MQPRRNRCHSLVDVMRSDPAGRTLHSRSARRVCCAVTRHRSRAAVHGCALLATDSQKQPTVAGQAATAWTCEIPECVSVLAAGKTRYAHGDDILLSMEEICPQTVRGRGYSLSANRSQLGIVRAFCSQCPRLFHSMSANDPRAFHPTSGVATTRARVRPRAISGTNDYIRSAIDCA